jgi:glycine cleavage system H protein
MSLVRSCNFPDNLFYDVPRHVWYSPSSDGLVRIGVTPVGVALAREVLIFTPKRLGKPFEQGRAVATVESAKWVGSVRAAFAGTVEVINEALVAHAASVNSDCYGEGWMLLVRSADTDWHSGLITGAAIAPAYEAWMEENGFEGCVSCS